MRLYLFVSRLGKFRLGNVRRTTTLGQEVVPGQEVQMEWLTLRPPLTLMIPKNTTLLGCVTIGASADKTSAVLTIEDGLALKDVLPVGADFDVDAIEQDLLGLAIAAALKDAAGISKAQIHLPQQSRYAVGVSYQEHPLVLEACNQGFKASAVRESQGPWRALQLWQNHRAAA